MGPEPDHFENWMVRIRIYLRAKVEEELLLVLLLLIIALYARFHILICYARRLFRDPQEGLQNSTSAETVDSSIRSYYMMLDADRLTGW